MKHKSPPRHTRHLHFLGLVATGDIDDCWLWRGNVMKNGYGYYGRKLAHRQAYEYWVGDIPDDMTIDHLCAVKNCVNPNHMEVVTLAENIRRGPLGVGNWNKRKTHCKYGHPFNLENTYVRKEGNRMCRACLAAAQEKRRNAAA